MDAGKNRINVAQLPSSNHERGGKTPEAAEGQRLGLAPPSSLVFYGMFQLSKNKYWQCCSLVFDMGDMDCVATYWPGMSLRVCL